MQVKAPPGWQFAMPQAAPLTTVGMLHGRPEESGYLVPAETKNSKQGDRSGWTQRWQFDLPHWYPTFVYCGYGGGSGPLQLYFSISRDATECVATSSGKDGLLEVGTFVCS